MKQANGTSLAKCVGVNNVSQGMNQANGTSLAKCVGVNNV